MPEDELTAAPDVCVYPATDEDLPAIAALMERVQVATGGLYPPAETIRRLIDPSGSVQTWLTRRPAQHRFVAQLEEPASPTIGYVELELLHVTAQTHPQLLEEYWSEAFPAAANDEAAAVELEGLAIVKRLAVDPGAHGAGVGWQLLTRARRCAVDLGLQPALIVDARLAQAIALYRRAGAQHVRRFAEPGSGTIMDSYWWPED